MSLKTLAKPITTNKTKTTIASGKHNPHKEITRAEAISTL